MQSQPNAATVAIPLRRRDGTVRAVALVDAIDAHLAQHRWHVSANGYAGRKITVGPAKQTTVYLHRQVLGLADDDSLEVDHVNRDKLDNRRANLRSVARWANQQNLPPQANKTSQHRGVSWIERERKWRADVTVRGCRHYLGTFDNEESAASAAVEARRRLMPFSET